MMSVTPAGGSAAVGSSIVFDLVPLASSSLYAMASVPPPSREEFPVSPGKAPATPEVEPARNPVPEMPPPDPVKPETEPSRQPDTRHRH